VTKVFDEEASPNTETGSLVWTKEIILTSPGGRKQIQLQVAREAGQVREIKIQKVPKDGDSVDDLLTLNRDASQRLIQMIRGLDYIPIEGGAPGVKVDDDLIRDVFSDPDAINAMYRSDPEQFRELVANDDSAGTSSPLLIAGRSSSDFVNYSLTMSFSSVKERGPGVQEGLAKVP
jgi:hypothetical protein